MILKGAALITFVTLITAFVLYRSGRMNELIQVSPNGGTLHSFQADSTVSDTNAINADRMASSKVIILTDRLHSDTASSLTVEEINRMYDMMSSSKSGVIFKPKQLDTIQK